MQFGCSRKNPQGFIAPNDKKETHCPNTKREILGFPVGLSTYVIIFIYMCDVYIKYLL